MGKCIRNAVFIVLWFITFLIMKDIGGWKVAGLGFISTMFYTGYILTMLYDED